MELLIGAGANKHKKFGIESTNLYEGTPWIKLVTLDVNSHCKPDILHDLNNLPLPFEDESFDEIHAYDVLEHVGKQGDYEFFFAQFSDFWRILKPFGYLVGICPRWDGPWAFGDPSHTRIISPHSFVFLDQEQYTKQVGHTAMSDFRHIYKADFALCKFVESSDVFGFVLQAIKPSRISI